MIKKALLEAGTAIMLNQDILSRASPEAIAVFHGRIVAVEWVDSDGRRYWDDENIVSSSVIIKISK